MSDSHVITVKWLDDEADLCVLSSQVSFLLINLKYFFSLLNKKIVDTTLSNLVLSVFVGCQCKLW